jgi:hypothetical protein
LPEGGKGEMNNEKQWKTIGEACIDFSLALKDVETHIHEMGGCIENIKEISSDLYNYPDGYIGAEIKMSFRASELREYISRLPPHASSNSEG